MGETSNKLYAAPHLSRKFRLHGFGSHFRNIMDGSNHDKQWCYLSECATKRL